MQNCKSIFTAIAAGTFLFSISAAEKKQEPKYKYTHPIKCVSHAGDAKSAPPHSAAAYRIAMQHKTDVMKLDIRYSKDAIPVLSHDGTLKRVMNWKVGLHEKTLAEIKEKDLLPRGGYDSEKLQSLPEALEIVKECPEFWYDPKGTFNEARFKKSLKEFEKAGINLDRIMIATWGNKPLSFVMQEFPQIRRVKHIQLCYSTKKKGTVFSTIGFPETGGNQKDIVKLLLKKRDEFKLYGLNLPIRAVKDGLLTAEDIKTLRDAGVWISLWFINTAEDADLAAKVGADAFVTDKLEPVLPYCRRNSKVQTDLKK